MAISYIGTRVEVIAVTARVVDEVRSQSELARGSPAQAGVGPHSERTGTPSPVFSLRVRDKYV